MKKYTRNKINPNREKSTNKTFKMMNCSPIHEDQRISKYSCYTKPILIKIQQEYNKHHPTNQIHASNDIDLWTKLKNNFTTCSKEDCWLQEIKDASIRKNIQEYIFAPKHPPEWNDNPNEWLSNIDIEKVLAQYQKKYKKFIMLGPTTIDFDSKPTELNHKCVEERLCKFSLEEYVKKGKTKIGIVFNLDKFDESGSHWVSMFIDVDEQIIFYFDSANDEIPNEMKKLVDRIQTQGLHLKKPVHFKYYDSARARHQMGSTECGMYSLFFIITMLTSKSESNKKMTMKDKIRLFTKKSIPDKYVEKYRKIYFNG
jgi:hypothetical protein